MRVALFAMVLLCPVLATAQDKDKKDDKADAITYKLDYLDKTFGLKLKSTSTMPHEQETGLLLVKMTMEFSKDIDNLDELKKTLAPPQKGALLPKGGLPPGSLQYHYFDGDSVLLGKSPITRIDGELSGQQGDAIRIAIELPKNVYPKIRKIEPRPYKP